MVTSITRNEVRRCVSGIELQDGPFLVDKNVCEETSTTGSWSTSRSGSSRRACPGHGLHAHECREQRRDRARRSSGHWAAAGRGRQRARAQRPRAPRERLSGSASRTHALGNREAGVRLFVTDGELRDNNVRGNGFFGAQRLRRPLAADGGSFQGGNLVRATPCRTRRGDGIRVLVHATSWTTTWSRQRPSDGIRSTATAPRLQTPSRPTRSPPRPRRNRQLAASTLISDNTSKRTAARTLAGVRPRSGTVDPASSGNVSGDGTDLHESSVAGDEHVHQTERTLLTAATVHE